MKKVICALVMFIGFGCATVEFQEDSSVIQLPGMSKQQIFQKATQWITYKFASGRAVIDYKDFNAGRIIAKGSIPIQMMMGSRLDVNMVTTIDCVNGKSKITVVPTDCASVAPNGNRFPCSGLYATPDALEDVQVRPKKFIEEYKNYMTGGKAPAWDGR